MWASPKRRSEGHAQPARKQGRVICRTRRPVPYRLTILPDMYVMRNSKHWHLIGLSGTFQQMPQPTYMHGGAAHRAVCGCDCQAVRIHARTAIHPCAASTNRDCAHMRHVVLRPEPAPQYTDTIDENKVCPRQAPRPQAGQQWLGRLVRQRT